MWVDGVYVKAGLEREKAAILVVMAALSDGRKVVVSAIPGYRESIESWSDVLRDMRRQDPMRYALTVQENIGFGMLEKLPDSDAIESAAQASSAAGAIETLPGQYQALLGKEFEGGHDLSLGQWQKLAIARVYLRDADILDSLAKRPV